MKISAKLVKELREKTSAGILDCRKALDANNGNLEEATKWLREKGIAKASKKTSRVAAEGVVHTAIDKNIAVIFELNSETDFVAKNEKFLKLIDIISKALLTNPSVKTVNEALSLSVSNSNLETIINEYIAVIGEKLSLRRFKIFNLNEGQSFGSYVHNQRKGTLVLFKGKTKDLALKQICMHITAMVPKFVSKKDISEDFIKTEKEILMKKSLAEGKPKNIVEKMVAGRLNKMLSELCLVDQNFVIDPSIKVSKFLKDNNLDILEMVYYEVGEGIQKESLDFAEEVMKQMKK